MKSARRILFAMSIGLLAFYLLTRGSMGPTVEQGSILAIDVSGAYVEAPEAPLLSRLTIDRNGNLGIGVSRPAHPLEMASGAHATAGGVWTNSSSRENKENISELTVIDALAALAELQPVQFNYKNDGQENYVGFIAEDVPELLATADRKGLSAMDIVAVLTKVVQAQQRQIEALDARLAE